MWDACARFMAQLYWHKPRLVTLGPKIEALSDNHPSKAQCLCNLSVLFTSVGNVVEQKRLLNHALKLWRGQGDDSNAAQALSHLSDANQRMGLYEEGIKQAEEASRVFEWLGHPVHQAESLVKLAWLLLRKERLDEAEEMAFHAIDLLPEEGGQICTCNCHRVLGAIYQRKGEMEKAVHYFEIALGIAFTLNRAKNLFWVHFNLADLFSQRGKFCDAQTHIERAKSFAANNTYLSALASVLQARLWYEQDTFGEARSEALASLGVLEKLGSVVDVEAARWLLQQIDAQWPGHS